MKKLIIITLVMLVCGFAFKAGSQRQSNERILKVAILITGEEDSLYDDLLERQIRLSLQAEPDVKLVDFEEKWDVIITISTLTIELEKIGNIESHVILDIEFFLNVIDNCPNWEEHEIIKPVMFPNPGYLIFDKKSKITEFKDIIMNNFDKEILTPFRR